MNELKPKNYYKSEEFFLFGDEKDKLEKVAKNFNEKLNFTPENVLMEEESGIMFCMNWKLKINNSSIILEKNKILNSEDIPLSLKTLSIKENLNDFSKKEIEELEKKIKYKQKNISEQLFGLIVLKNLNLKKIRNPKESDVISVEKFLEIAKY